ncbi:DUF560 domain-containing protein [Erythrobacter insulae]|uniref:DUF560 domain-containing protein n=1 Tax=Erythrobacter insulae TaxID=2584124 RepID=A0A547PCR5_9SPHN|nr:porin family protein [Erythrobacter insulae]TRD11932.1 DUF560 domain-containing protein [Erythrobacter insulae]
MKNWVFSAIWILFAAWHGHALAQESESSEMASSPDSISLSPAQLFEFADKARSGGNYDTAESAYRALIQNSPMELRNEARFRLALMFADDLDRPQTAAILLREILDEQPDVARVRLELARMQIKLGNLREAERQLRAAQAAGLPPEVERAVRFFTSSMSAAKPFGVDFEVALAPDSNINRATRSDSLETVIGDFTLSDDAQETSGVGLALQGQARYRETLAGSTNLNLSASARGRLYRESQFDDYIVSLQAGPEFLSGSDRIRMNATASWRWFGTRPFTFSYGATADFRHILAKRAQLRMDGAIVHSDDRLNDLRSSDRISLSAGVDRAFTAQSGGGIRVSGARAIANDPGFSSVDAGIDMYAFRELGPVTLVASAGYNRLEFDERLLLFPRRRIDDRVELSLSGTFRNLRIGPLAPVVRIRFEDNQSTVGINDFQRVATEFGFGIAL